jgi:biopolymer transport protein ExbD
MVTTPIIMNPSVHVNLPKAASGDQTVPSQLNISIDKDGICYFNGKEVSNELLSTMSKEQIGKNPDVQAIISADASVQHGRVIEVIDVVKSAGVTKFAISISKK